MKLEERHIILIVSGTLLLTAAGVGLYLLFRDKDTSKDEKKKSTDKGDKPTSTVKEPPAGNYNQSSSTSTQTAGKVSPRFNEENELINPLTELKGRLIYPKRKYLGGWDYTNVRSSAEVNTESAWYDPFDNLLTTIGAGTPVGKIMSSTTGLFNNHPYRWFKVKLLKEVGAWGTDEGYVRADTVTFIPYSK